MAKKKFKIEGMDCSSCALNIDWDLEDLDGVKSSKTSYAKGKCEVEFDKDKIEEFKILETIKKSGYSGKLID